MNIARPSWFLAMLGLVSTARAQIPNWIIKLDGVVSVRKIDGGRTKLFAYDDMGRHSVVTLGLSIEPGFDIVVSRRFQSIENDADTDRFDEYYIEDRDYWRLGKQYVRFGSGAILRESLPAVRIDLRAGPTDIPLTITGFEGKGTRHEGFAVRIGSEVGLSVALGRHIGSNATALTYIRAPEDSSGKFGGYREAFGLDFQIPAGPIWLGFEHMSLRRGERLEHANLDITDFSATYGPKTRLHVSAGLTHEWSEQSTFFRLHISQEIAPGFALEPFVRIRNGKIWMLGVGLRVRP